MHQFKPFSPREAQSMLQLSRIKAERLNKRASLLRTVDQLRRDADAKGEFEAADSFTRQAVEVVLAGKMADALDLNQESPSVHERYCGDKRGRLRDNERFLRARRLVEAGVRCVAMQWGGWDTHGGNFTTLRTQLPALDRGLSALISDFTEVKKNLKTLSGKNFELEEKFNDLIQYLRVNSIAVPNL